MVKLPISIDNDIHLRPADKEMVKTTSKILGARHGEYIIIDHPVIRMSERIVAHLDGDLLCWFFHEGNTYKFHSRIIKKLAHQVSLLDYPSVSAVDIQKVWKSHRIQVNLEVLMTIDGIRGTIRAIMDDISEGGCSITIPSLEVVAKDRACTMDFALVNGEKVKGLTGIVRSVRHVALKKITELGVQFTGPPELLDKIVAFCQLCMYFKV